VLQKLQDIYLNIDRCLDIDDRRGFGRASQELREFLSRLRDHLDNTSVTDIAARGMPR
jgi:GGDEF domain-containing protein